jgi:hypothetical protein
MLPPPPDILTCICLDALPIQRAASGVGRRRQRAKRRTRSAIRGGRARRATYVELHLALNSTTSVRTNVVDARQTVRSPCRAGDGEGHARAEKGLKLRGSCEIVAAHRPQVRILRGGICRCCAGRGWRRRPRRTGIRVRRNGWRTGRRRRRPGLSAASSCNAHARDAPGNHAY